MGLLTQFRTDRRSRFGRNVIRLASANVLGQALTLATAPILTRVYAPSDFAALALFSSVVSMLLACATLRFEWSVPNASSRPLAVGAMVHALLSLAVFCVLAAALLGPGRHLLSSWNTAQVIGPALLLAPVAVLAGGVQQILQSWFVREADLGPVGRARISQSVATASLSLALVPWARGGLIASAALGPWVGLVPLARTQLPALRRAAHRLSRPRLALAWRRFAKDSLLSSAASLANMAGLTLLPIWLAQHFSAAEIGWFALAQRIALAPVGLVSSAVGQGFWAEAARLARQDRPALRRLYLRSSARLALLSLPVAAFCLAGPLFMGPVFGKLEWSRAGILLTALTPMLVSQLIVSPVSHLVVHRRQSWQMIWDVVRVCLMGLAVVLCARAHLGIAATVFAVALVAMAMYVVLFFLNLRCLRRSA